MTDGAAAAGGPPGTDTGALRLLRSFANTLGPGADGDLLGAREEAIGWLRDAGLLPAGERLTGSEHNALLRLRASLRDVLAAHADGREEPGAAARLTRGLADGRLVVIAGSAAAIHLATAARACYPTIVASLAVAIARSAASGTWLRLKLCPEPGCGQAFIDDSAAGAIGRCSACSG